jgi:hypothetical protein
MRKRCFSRADISFYSDEVVIHWVKCETSNVKREW